MQPQPSMEMVLRELNHPAHNDQLKNQQQVTFKLVKTGEYTKYFIDIILLCRFYYNLHPVLKTLLLFHLFSRKTNFNMNNVIASVEPLFVK